MFGLFVIKNGGIVVGDKENHAPVLHLAQPLYCVLIAGGALVAAEAGELCLYLVGIDLDSMTSDRSSSAMAARRARELDPEGSLSAVSLLTDASLVVSVLSCGLGGSPYEHDGS